MKRQWSLLAVGLLLLCAAARSTHSGAQGAPEEYAPRRYTVSLDVPARSRWLNVLRAERSTVALIYAGFESGVPMRYLEKSAPASTRAIYADIKASHGVIIAGWPADLRHELLGVSDFLGNGSMPALLMYNMMYEFCRRARATAGFASIQCPEGTGYSTTERSNPVGGVGCTSVVLGDTMGRLTHGRNMDWEWRLQRNATIFVQFKKMNRIVYSTVTWPLYVGASTGQRDGAFSISLNARERDDGASYAAWLRQGRPAYGTQAFLIRQTLATCNTWSDAVRRLNDTPVASQSYITVAGVQFDEAVVITRERTGGVHGRRLGSHHGNGTWYLVQTNDDWWRPPVDERRAVAVHAVEKVGQAGAGISAVWTVLSTQPVLNDITLFTSVMSARSMHSADVYAHTKIRRVV